MLKPRSVCASFALLLAFLLASLPGALYAQSQGDKVYGLRGMLTAAAGQPFGHYLDAEDGTRYGVVGATPAVELELTTLAQTQPDATISIWGDIRAGSDAGPAVIIVTDVLAPQPPTATPMPSPVLPVVAIVEAETSPLRSGPAAVYPLIRLLRRGEACEAFGKNRKQAGWYQVRCAADNNVGWLRADAVRFIGDPSALPIVAAPPTPEAVATRAPTATPKPTATRRPAPTATATPVPPPRRGQWRGQYFNRPNLAGNPVVDRLEGRDGSYPLDRAWNGSPVAGVVAAGWSARWSGPFYFESGDYLFQTDFSGGGVRVFIDGIRIIGGWERDSRRMSNRFLDIGAGDHTITVEHSGRSVPGHVRVWWAKETSGTRDE